MPMDLILNLSLLVALTVVSTFFWRRFSPQQTPGAVIQGCLFGAVTVVGMIRPLVLEPGLIFDGRSMMLSLCALFFGPRAAIISVIAPTLYRAGLGGPGVYMGVLSIYSSAGVGLWFHHRWRNRAVPPTTWELLWFGLVVHVALLCMTIALPDAVRWQTLKKLGFPILLLYPGLTVLAGKILTDQVNLNRLITELRQTNQHLDITLRSIADGVIATDLQGRVTHLNPTAEELTGWAKSEARGRPLEEVFRIINEFSRQPVENPVQRVLKEGHVVGLANHTILLNRQGKEFSIADSAAPILDDGGRCRGVVLVFRDQTREREAHNALMESESRYRTLVESAPALVWRCAPDGKLEYFNQRWLHYRGRSLADEQAQGWKAGVHPDDLPRREESLRQALEKKQPLQMEYRLLRHDGHYCWLYEEAVPVFDHQGKFQGCIGFCLDVTAQREAMEREQMLISALETSASCIFLAEPTGFIEWVNSAFVQRVQMPRESIVQKNWEDFFDGVPQSPQSLPKGMEDLLEILLAGKVWRGELLVRGPSGRTFEADCVLSPVRNSQGQIVKVVGIFEDNTARKSMQEELRQAQKMEIFGLIANSVAHDFNNILTTISISADMLKEAPELPESLKTDVLEILNAARLGSNLTGQLLGLGRKQPVQWEELELNEVVAETCKMLRRTIGEHIQLDLQLSPGKCWMHGDRNRLIQVIMNLSLNARDAMPNSGRLTLKTTYVEHHGPLTFGDKLPDNGPYILLTVQDTGCGMTPEVVSRIFTPFFTTKKPGHGTGLGLNVVRDAVQDLHGGIHLQSKPGEGTTFLLYFPATRCPLGSLLPQTETPTPKGTETILLVEDEATVREMTARALRRLGYTVLPASHGREALKIFQENRSHIPLVITDIIMPGNLRGDELAAQLLEMDPTLKIIFMSGYPGESPEIKPELFKERVFLQKPFTPRKLGLVVREVLDKPPT